VVPLNMVVLKLITITFNMVVLKLITITFHPKFRASAGPKSRGSLPGLFM